VSSAREWNETQTHMHSTWKRRSCAYVWKKHTLKEVRCLFI